MIVLSWSKATRDLLKSLGWGIRALHQLGTATMVPSPRRLPHTISPGAVAAAAVGRDGEALSLGIARIAEPLPPAADALDRKCGGIRLDSDVDPSLVGGNVVDAVGRHFA